MIAMSAGGVAAIIAAVVWAVVAVFISLVMVNVFRVLESLKLTIDETRGQTMPLLGEVRATVQEVNKELDQVDGALGSVKGIIKNAERLSSVVEQTVSSPLIKLAALGAGLAGPCGAARRSRSGMRRRFWLAVGLGAGVTAAVLIARWSKRQRERLSPANLGKQAGQVARDTGSLVSEMAKEFRTGMAEREAEIRGGLPT